MRTKFFLEILILFILVSFISPSKKVKKKISQHKNILKEELILTLYKWANKNNIYISDKLKINKNTDSLHNFYYFTSNETIPNNTILLKVPYDSMISQSSLEKYFQEKRNKKFAYLWERILEIKNKYISYFSTKQYLYMSIIIENAINKKKGWIYNKFKPYFDMYEYMNMDNFPVFYDDEEIHYLSTSSFGAELEQAVQSLKEEYYIINNDLQISSSIQDNFLKYRVLSLANSISFNNTKISAKYDANDSVIVPFIDCFKRAAVSYNINAEYEIKHDKNNNYYLEIKTIDKIPKDEEIYLRWNRMPNNDLLIYYGFIEKGNYLAPKYYVDVFNNLFKKDLGVDTKRTFSDVMQRGRFELSTEFFETDVIRSYKNLSKLFDEYKNRPEGFYEMMADNLNYYLQMYDGQFSDGNINLYIKGNNKRKFVKTLMKLEKRLIQNKMNYVKSVIKDIKDGVAKPPEDL